jgi:hypothetical protein
VLTVLLSLSLADAGWVVSPVSPLVKVAEAAVVLVVAVVPVALPWLSLIESLCDPPSVGTDAVALALGDRRGTRLSALARRAPSVARRASAGVTTTRHEQAATETTDCQPDPKVM